MSGAVLPQGPQVKCRFCGILYKPNKPWQHFCSPQCREQYWLRVRRLLKQEKVLEVDEHGFERLADIWERERPRGVDLAEMAMHPAYQRIIGMGPRAIPFLLRRLQRKPGHWFWALHAITGANPVSSEDEGNIQAMAAAWLAWGKRRGYVLEEAQ